MSAGEHHRPHYLSHPLIQFEHVVRFLSAAHYFSKLDKENFLLEKEGSYDPWVAYGNSKLANILFTKELAKKINSASNDLPISTYTLHPGGCRTELGRFILESPPIPKPLWYTLGSIALLPAVYLTKSAEQGAQTQIFLSASPSLSKKESGSYFDNSKIASVSDAAKDDNLAEWLWQRSEQLTNTKFKI